MKIQKWAVNRNVTKTEQHQKEVEAEREFARKYGRNRIYKILNSLLNIKIPANAL